MNKYIIITGKPRSGKSTLVSRLIDFLKLKNKRIGGISTPEIRINNIRYGFKIIDIYNKEEGILSHINQKSGPRVGKYIVNMNDLNNIGVNAIKFAIENCDIIIIDEIGKMELFSNEFINIVDKAFNSNKVVIATMGLNLRHPFINKIKNRTDINIYTLTPNTREQLFQEIKKKYFS